MVGGRDVDLHIWIHLLDFLLLDEVLHEVFFGVDLIADELTADIGLGTTGSIGPVVELTHLLTLTLQE